MNWTELNRALLTASEEGCAALLATELAGPRRVAFLLRIHGRFNKLRARREREELLKEGVPR